MANHWSISIFYAFCNNEHKAINPLAAPLVLGYACRLLFSVQPTWFTMASQADYAYLLMKSCSETKYTACEPLFISFLTLCLHFLLCKVCDV